MSRTFSAVEEPGVPSSYIDRAALLLDEGTVFYQKTPYEEALEKIRREQGQGDEEEEPEGETAKTIAELIGHEVLGPYGERYIVQWAPGVKPERVEGMLAYVPLTQLLVLKSGNRTMAFRPGRYVDTVSARLFDVTDTGVRVSGRTLTAGERGGLGLGFSPTGSTGGGGGGGGGSTGRTQFASEEALDRAQADRLAAQTEIDREAMQIDRDRLAAEIADTEAQLAWAQKEFELAEAAKDRRAAERARLEMEMLEKRLKNSNRELAFSMAMQERSTLIQAKSQERGRQVDIAGKDIFRFAGTIRGRDTTGQTPMDIFKTQGQAFLNQPLPTPNMSMTVEELQNTLTGMQGMQPPTPAGFGFAKGGVIDMERGGDGAFSMRPKQAFLVGDGAGIIPGVTEVLTVGDGKVEVTPLAGQAQGGLRMPANIGQINPGLIDFLPGNRPGRFQGSAQPSVGGGGSGMSLGGFSDLFDFLRKSVGYTNPGLTTGVTDILFPSQASKLGAFSMAPGTLVASAPRGGGEGLEGPAYVIDEQGRLRGFESSEIFLKSGFKFEDIKPLWPQQLARLERGPNIGATPFSMPPQASSYGTLAQPISTLPGYLDMARAGVISAEDAYSLANQVGWLPAPKKIAADWRDFDPIEQRGLLSAYEMGGFPQESFLGRIEEFTPTGRTSRPQRIGGVGTRI